jgi:hypothetical protein
VVEHWEELRGRPARVIAVGCYLGWLAVFDSYYLFVNELTRAFYWEVVEAAAGLPTFVFGCGFIVAAVCSANLASRGVAPQPGRPDTNAPDAGVDPIV